MTGSLDGTVRLWDVSSEGAAIQTITAEKFAGVNAMARDEGGSIYMGLTSGSMQVVRDGQTVEVIAGQAGGMMTGTLQSFHLRFPKQDRHS